MNQGAFSKLSDSCIFKKSESETKCTYFRFKRLWTEAAVTDDGWEWFINHETTWNKELFS